LYRGVYKFDQITLGKPKEICEFDIAPSPLSQPENEVEEQTQDTCEISISTEEIIEMARMEAQKIMEKAELECQKKLEEAEREAQKRSIQIEENARKKGFEQGLNEAKEEYQSKLKEADEIIARAKTTHDAVLEGMEAEILDLVLEVVRSVVECEIKTNRESIVEIFKHALEKCSNRENIILKASPLDFEIIEKSKESFLASIQGLGKLEIIEDSSLAPGDCIIETSFGSLNAGINKKLEIVEREFKKLLSGG
jgi:flagellar assembly protein FliH